MHGWIYSLCGTPMFQSNGIYDILQFFGLLRYPPVALVDGVHLLDEAVGLGHHGPDPARHGGQHVRLGRLVTRQGQLHLSLLMLEIVESNLFQTRHFSFLLRCFCLR